MSRSSIDEVSKCNRYVLSCMKRGNDYIYDAARNGDGAMHQALL